jgi:2-keto-4-pentenoate hydratase/2-oxohepta-3-ene-1,7-dioic acid hydratase in catechol pathway
MRAGDLIGTGTISGPHESMYGCLLELTWRGTKDVVIRRSPIGTHESNGSADSLCRSNDRGRNADGVVDDSIDTTENTGIDVSSAYEVTAAAPALSSVTRRYLEDGDVVRMSGFAQGRGYRVGFGEVMGRVMPAIEVPY